MHSWVHAPLHPPPLGGGEESDQHSFTAEGTPGGPLARCHEAYKKRGGGRMVALPMQMEKRDEEMSLRSRLGAQ